MLKFVSDVPWLAILAAGVAHFMLGGAWFMGLVAKHYPVALGRNDPPGAKSAPLMIVGPAVCSFVIIATTALLLKALAIVSYGDAIVFGAFIGLGLLTPMVMVIAINPNFPRPFYYTAINAPYFVLGSILSCVILTAMS
jgi:Protein of unknown function (DUF1761)